LGDDRSAIDISADVIRRPNRVSRDNARGPAVEGDTMTGTIDMGGGRTGEWNAQKAK
jgi:hypothetical protein